MTALVCKKCGCCCYYQDDKGDQIPCKFLKDKKCTIYDKRLGTTVAKVKAGLVVCNYRIYHPHKYPGCPYNELIEVEDG